MPKAFIHPRSREAEYTSARLARDVRVRDQGLYRRVVRRYPLIALFKFVYATCLQHKDKRNYTYKDMAKIAEYYFGHALTQLQDGKDNIYKQQKMIAFYQTLYQYQNGAFEFPDLTDECNLVSIMAWDGYSSKAYAIRTFKIGRSDFVIK